MLKELRSALQGRAMATRFIVGMAGEPEVRDYAKVFGGDTLLDLDNAIPAGGVPHLFLSDDSGTVIHHISGAPRTLEAALDWSLRD